MKYRFWRNQETRAMRSADAVVCICAQLKKEVVERGVPAERVFIVPNAVDPEVFQVASSDSGGTGAPVSPQLEQVRARLRPVTIGYVGSIRKLEGVDALVRAGAEIIRRGVDMSLLIVGDGVDLKSLKELAGELGIAERVVFTGRVPHDEVTSYYDLIDIFVVSRPRLRVTEMVTPLKPLEAMAMGKALIVSDLQSLQEIVHDGDTGLTYRADDVSDLAEKCIALINDKPLRERLAKRAAEWIREKRTWRLVLSNLDGAYKVAMENCAARQASAPKGAPRPGEAS
jgi:glycosyltransferase involved in cell wall biosynthesis